MSVFKLKLNLTCQTDFILEFFRLARGKREASARLAWEEREGRVRFKWKSTRPVSPVLQAKLNSSALLRSTSLRTDEFSNSKQVNNFSG